MGDTTAPEFISESLESLMPVKNKVGLILGLPLGRKEVRREWAHAMMTIAWPLNITIMHSVVTDIAIADARNLICKQAQEVGAKFIWFVDDDTVPPNASIRMLMYQLDQNPEVLAIGGIYCCKTEPTQPMVFKDFGSGSDWDWTLGETFECAAIGTGCMLIRTEHLEKLPYPWFKTIDVATQGGNQLDTRAIQCTDDVYFCKLAKVAGLKILAHGGVLCHHWDMETGKVYKLPEDSLPYRNKQKKEK
jgi:Glycosyl transferase family 2